MHFHHLGFDILYSRRKFLWTLRNTTHDFSRGELHIMQNVTSLVESCISCKMYEMKSWKMWRLETLFFNMIVQNYIMCIFVCKKRMELNKCPFLFWTSLFVTRTNAYNLPTVWRYLAEFLPTLATVWRWFYDKMSSTYIWRLSTEWRRCAGDSWPIFKKIHQEVL